MHHLVFRVVYGNQRPFKWRTFLELAFVLQILFVQLLQPVLAAVNLMVKHCCVFNVIFNTFVVTVKLHNQVMKNRFTAVVSHQRSWFARQMHAVYYLQKYVKHKPWLWLSIFSTTHSDIVACLEPFADTFQCFNGSGFVDFEYWKQKKRFLFYEIWIRNLIRACL